MEIVAVGAGALGSWALDILAKRMVALGIKPNIRIIDFDEVDDRNFANQFFTLEHKTKPKAEVMAERLRGYGLEVEAVVEKITEANIEDLIDPKKTNIILDMVDNAEARTLLYAYSIMHDRAVLHSGVSKAGHGTVTWTVKGYDNWFNEGIKGRLQGNSTQNAEGAADEKLPPCEMLEFASLCMITAMATAQAVTMYYGKDPENVFRGANVPATTMIHLKTIPTKYWVDNNKGVKVHDEEAEAQNAGEGESPQETEEPKAVVQEGKEEHETEPVAAAEG